MCVWAHRIVSLQNHCWSTMLYISSTWNRKTHKILKSIMRFKLIKSYIRNVNAYHFNSSYISCTVYHNILVIRTENSVIIAGINNVRHIAIYPNTTCLYSLIHAGRNEWAMPNFIQCGIKQYSEQHCHISGLCVLFYHILKEYTICHL